MRSRVSWIFGMVIFFCGTLVTVLAGGDDTGAKAPAPTAAPSAAAASASESAPDPVIHRDPNAPLCLPDATAIEDLEKRRLELDKQERDLAAREADFKSREKALNEELKKLQEARDDIEKIDTSRKKENDEKVGKLVETFETMSPKAAGQVLSSLDEALAVAAISKMDTPKLAKILNGMDPERSARLTEILAGVVRARKASGTDGRQTASHGAAVATNSSTKGGENHDGQSEQQRNSSREHENAGPAKGSGAGNAK